ncbi:MAG: tRNA (adenosine(37)-N6)-threonylcarbamoyltransferase complex transferase subunit TsaD [Candidatus Geothermincolia bacterium]
MIVLGIETSCDESAAALVVDGVKVLSNVVASQVDLHMAYGGVVPEIAARAHVEAIAPVLSEALSAAGARPDLVAVTAGPGLVGSLVVGLSAAKALAWAWSVPMVAVNHLEAHIFAAALEGALPDVPFLALVVSGGHTLLAEVRAIDDIEILGQTQDDAVGEAYDKVAKFLGLGYPGGPVIDSLAREGNPSAIKFPRAMLHSGDYNFSLSGLKTAVIRYMARVESEGGRLPAIPDIAASFQAAALEVLVRKTVAAAMDRGLRDVVIGGGVACNSALREWLAAECDKEGLRLAPTSPALCTDNAAMVAAAGYMRFEAGYRCGLEADVFPNLRLGAPMGSDPGCAPATKRSPS